MAYRGAEKQRGWTILQKGLMIISIPLLFALFFVIVLIHLVDEANAHITAEMDSQDKIACVETMIKEVSDSTTSAVLYNLTRRPDFNARNQRSRAHFFKTYRRLTKLVSKDPAEMKAAQELYSGALVWLAQQDQHANEPPKERLSDIFHGQMESQAQGLSLMRPEGPAQVILEKEEKVQQLAPELHKQSINRIAALFIFGLVVNVSITIALAMYFARYVSRRLDNVLTNTLRLGARLPLEPPLRG